MPELKIQFPNQEALNGFVLWLNCFGEQCYWAWIEEQQNKTSTPITCEFEYHRDGKFMPTNGLRALIREGF